MPLKTNDWIKDLSDKYNLNDTIVVEEIEHVISSVLSKRFGFEVETRLNGGPEDLSICGFKMRREDMKPFISTISPENIKRPLIREILYKLANALEIRKLFNEYSLYKTIIHTAVTGEIIKKKSDELYVALKGIDYPASDQYTVAVCEQAHQTPKERGWYMVGQTMPFYALSVKPALLKGTPRLVIRLSRNSTGLPECLIRRELITQNMDINIRCTGRIAGAFSEIKASAKIPRDCIKKVSDELKERVIVRW
ncbi:MAG TPA: hypothetical protein DHW81_01535 [Nitrospiraceae bacterium]|nr:MAG: hypothetical protein A2X55_09060 [Nitrospirae bacterium GWB2_47_37]HAK87660.1 hypothetical protein [Nitrospiraceae bacterium]HCL80943.1 hypothetical protein [Nitrospiraceae bacterium]